MKLMIGGKLCDTETEPQRCIEKMWAYMEKINNDLCKVENNNTFSDIWSLETRIDELESQVDILVRQLENKNK